MSGEFDNEATNGAGLSSLASNLESALVAVRAAKANKDEADTGAAEAKDAYQKAVSVVQKAKAAYDEHINEAISGFAQLHQ